MPETDIRFTMVGQLRLKAHIDDWEGDDEATFYAADVDRRREPRNLDGSSTSSSNSSTSDLSGNADGLQNSNRTNEVLDALRSQSSPPGAEPVKSTEVSVNKVCKFIGKVHSNVAMSIIVLVTVSAVSCLLLSIAIKVVKPGPQWDKSLTAFEIPDHPTTLRREMFELAKKDRTASQRSRRSVTNAAVTDVWREQSALVNGNQYQQDAVRQRNALHENHIHSKLSRYRSHGIDIPDDVFNPIPASHLLHLGDQPLRDNGQLVNINDQTVNNKPLMHTEDKIVVKNFESRRTIEEVKNDDQMLKSKNPLMNNHLTNPNNDKFMHVNGEIFNEVKESKVFMDAEDFSTLNGNEGEGWDRESLTEAGPAESREHDVWKRSADSFRKRSQTWRLQLVYMAKGPDQNVFTAERLKMIHAVEMDIMKHRDFTRFCARNSHSRDDPALAQFNYCLPPNSLMTYFFPSEVDNVIRYDSMGTELADINGTLKMAMSKPTFYWFVDTHMNSTMRRSKFIRSEIWFGVPVGDGAVPRHDAYQAYKEFIFSYIELLSKASTDKVDVLYGGTEIFDHEVSETISHDIRLSIPTFVAIFILLFIFTSFSLWLTICGLLTIIYSFSCAYFCYRVFFGIKALGLLNVISAFVIIGIGVDDVFVFVNTFRQAVFIKDPASRMGHTISTAGTATFFTSITTAGAFGANMASQIPAIFDFGLFMMLLVLFCWLMVIAIMPPALNLWHRYLNCELHLAQKCKNRTSSSPSRQSSSLYRVLAQYESSESQPAPSGQQMTVVPTDQVLDDSDIPMLDLEEDAEEQGLLTDDDDVPLLHMSSATVAPPADQKEAASLTSALQKVLRRFIAHPVMRARWLVLILFCIVLCISVWLVSRLQPASRPPAVYQSDTNIQRLLDLAYNFSGKDITCRDCSGFEQGGSHMVLPGIPTAGYIDPGALTPKPGLPTDLPDRTIWPPSHRTLRPGGGGGAGGGDSVVTSSPTPSSDTSPRTGGEHHGKRTTPPTKRYTCKNMQLRCKFGAVCQDPGTDEEEPHCLCRMACDQTRLDPVCGSDGVTYANVCQLKYDACQDKKAVTVAKMGVCSGPPIIIPTSNARPDPPIVTPTADSHGSRSTAAGGNAPSRRPSVVPSSPGEGYDPCAGGGRHCEHAASRPLLDNTATIFLVFGLKDLDKTNVSTEHVLNEDKGSVVYDPDFHGTRFLTLQALCKICKMIGSNRDLVQEGGSECFPTGFLTKLRSYGMQLPAACNDLPVPKLLAGQRSHAKIHFRGRDVAWLAMAFESKIYEGKSSFEAYKDYLAWEKAIKETKEGLSEEEVVGLESAFQTCDYWQQAFMEIIGVTSAIYGVAFSLIVCVVAVTFFTAHLTILLIAVLTIAGVILVVVGTFYLLGWQMGAVEAVSLSILVGSSIDYCIHLVEGYRVAANHVTLESGKSWSEIRQQRTIHSVSTIGVSILSSALTTVIAAIPLCFTTVQLFAKFGQIVALNTLVAIVYTLTACSALLGCFAPARYKWSLRWLVLTLLVVCLLLGAGVMGLYAMHQRGVTIPGPSGNTLFG